MTSSWLINYKLKLPNKIYRFLKEKVEKCHLNLFAIRELYYHRLFKILNKVCSVIFSNNHPYHTDTSQSKSVYRFLHTTRPN